MFYYVDMREEVDSIDSGRPTTPDTDESSESHSQQGGTAPTRGAVAAPSGGDGDVVTDKQLVTHMLTHKKQPSQEDFETIKLVSNGAYG